MEKIQVSKDTELEQTMHQMDALRALQIFDSETIDLILTDPPYSSIEKHRSHGTTTRLKKSKSSSNVWFDNVPNEYFLPFLTEAYRVLKKNSTILIFCDGITQFVLHPIMENISFNIRKPLVWNKLTKEPYSVKCKCGKDIVCSHCQQEFKQHHTAMGMGYPFRSSYELIFFAEKGKRKVLTHSSKRNVKDLLSFPRLKGGLGWTGLPVLPAEKPIELLKSLLLQTTEVNDLVLDPFAGSGSTLEAARLLNRRFIGFDTNATLVDIFVKKQKEKEEKCIL